MNDDIVYFRILDEIRKQLPEFTNLVGADPGPRITAEAIVIRRTPMRLRPGEEWGQDEKTPGILISPSNTLRVPDELGDVPTDDVLYPVLIQIIDAGEGRYEESRLKAQLRWQTEIRRYLHNQNLRHAIFDSAGYVDLVQLAQADVFDESMWTLHRKCVCAMAFQVLSRETRNTQGSR